jgi:hypothetical protein
VQQYIHIFFRCQISTPWNFVVSVRGSRSQEQSWYGNVKMMSMTLPPELNPAGGSMWQIFQWTFFSLQNNNLYFITFAYIFNMFQPILFIIRYQLLQKRLTCVVIILTEKTIWTKAFRKINLAIKAYMITQPKSVQCRNKCDQQS